MRKGHGSNRHVYKPTAAHRRPPAPALPPMSSQDGGWLCSVCRRANLSGAPHPDPHTGSDDCTCACGLSWGTR